jgi:competence protein ComEC
MAFAERIGQGERGHVLDGAARALARLVDLLETTLEAERRQLASWLAVSFALGIALYFGAPFEPPLMLGLAAATAAALILWRSRRARLIASASGLAIFACTFGFLAAELRAREVAAPVLARAYGSALVEGIAREVVKEKSRMRVVLDVTSVRGLSKEKTPARIRLILLGEKVDLQPGTRIMARARLTPPPGPAAPDAYDFAREAWFEKIGAVGIAFGSPAPSTAPVEYGVGARFSLSVDRIRAAVGRHVQAHLAGDVGAVATALMNGDRANISDDVNVTFRASGLQHILSISGLHFSLMALGIYSALRLIFAAIEPLALRYPIKKWAAATALVGSLLYFLISGAAIPTARSFLMLGIVLLAVLVDRKALTMRNVAIAALAILLVKPESLFNVSFQMSFAAVAALIAAFDARRARGGQIADHDLSFSGRGLRYMGALALSSVVATAATAPFAAFHFHNFYGYGLPANMLALPVLGVLVMPAATLALLLMPFGLEGPALAVMGFGIELILAVARFVAHWPGAVLLLRALPLAAFLLIVAGGLWFCLWQTRWRRWGAAPMALGVVMALFAVPPDLMVDDDGEHVAARATDGTLVLLRGRATDYTGTTWLGRDADPRVLPFLDAPRAKNRPKGLYCDSWGCTYRLPAGKLLALSDAPASLADDCAEADIVIARIPMRRACTKPLLVIDRFALWRFGAHELWLSGGSIKVRHVQEARGDRFWSRPKPWRGED